MIGKRSKTTNEMQLSCKETQNDHKETVLSVIPLFFWEILVWTKMVDQLIDNEKMLFPYKYIFYSYIDHNVFFVCLSSEYQIVLPCLTFNSTEETNSFSSSAKCSFVVQGWMKTMSTIQSMCLCDGLEHITVWLRQKEWRDRCSADRQKKHQDLFTITRHLRMAEFSSCRAHRGCFTTKLWHFWAFWMSFYEVIAECQLHFLNFTLRWTTAHFLSGF